MHLRVGPYFSKVFTDYLILFLPAKILFNIIFIPARPKYVTMKPKPSFGIFRSSPHILPFGAPL